jgi:hypothetical protein
MVCWDGRKARKSGEFSELMVKVASSVDRHSEGTLASWMEGLSTTFREGLTSFFSAVKRNAGGFRSSLDMNPMRYFVSGKLRIPA